MKVLIVENDPTNQFIANKLFERDFEIRNAQNSLEALNYINNEFFDAILVDINLGPQSLKGDELMREMRKTEHGAEAKIIAVSSYAMPEEANNYVRAGFDLYVSKPYSRGKMLDSIMKLVKEE
jgi:CheY-like chemotaxis protein